jgi:phenylalanyl-tRNA synthetase alpha chain
MKDRIDTLNAEIDKATAQTAEQAEQLRIQFLGKKGSITQLFDDFKNNTSPEEKRTLGKILNELKTKATEKIELLKNSTNKGVEYKSSVIDPTLPGNSFTNGSRHPISLVRKKVVDIFAKVGFTVAEGPEIEDDWHNFTALNFPEEHPARDMQDTFFIENGANPIALRTHTSSVQVRMMENNKPPLRMVMPGRVYRNEAISARANCFFHQVEGLYIDEGVTFADLKQCLQHFSREMFGSNSQIRLRPSYFPFTEPSAEMDVSCPFCAGKGCNICKGSGWVEILGCGMVDPNVLDNCKIDSAKYTGFAFGMGIERMTMLLYGVNDLRLFFENDVRFLKQFEREI